MDERRRYQRASRLLEIRVLPLSIVGEISLKLSTRIGYSQIWPHKIPLGQNWLQVPLQEGFEDQSPTVDCVST